MRFTERKELIQHWRHAHNLASLSQLLRANVLSLIQEAGSGHIGSSFSVLDLALCIHYFEQKDSFPSEDAISYRLFSSKGHDAPALYALNHFLGVIPDEKMKLRRLHYLPGHPEKGIGGAVTSTGSLGMGISKAKGFGYADLLHGKNITNYVILGDGEMQEGQIWESMMDGEKIPAQTVAVVDANGIQSDTWVNRVRSLGDVRKRVEASGWRYLEVYGHHHSEILRALQEISSEPKPTVLWAQTQKGFGSKVTEYFPKDGLFYEHHSGALDPSMAETVFMHLLQDGGEAPAEQFDFSISPKMLSDNLPNIWARTLLKLGDEFPQVVVFDGDLALDTGTYAFAKRFENRYFQMGIAEQDMVSTAGTMSLNGFIPIVHSFATFLTMRPFEQIVNNALEGSRIVYVGFLAGVIPSAPGPTHQAILDASIMAAVPGMSILEPATQRELDLASKMALETDGPTYLRLASLPFPSLPVSAEIIEHDFGTQVVFGSQFLILCSGVLSFSESLEALERLRQEEQLGVVVTVVDKKNDFDIEQIQESLDSDAPAIVLENGRWFDGSLARAMSDLERLGHRVLRVSVDDFPKSGSASEIKELVGLSAETLVRLIQANFMPHDA